MPSNVGLPYLRKTEHAGGVILATGDGAVGGHGFDPLSLDDSWRLVTPAPTRRLDSVQSLPGSITVTLSGRRGHSQWVKSGPRAFLAKVKLPRTVLGVAAADAGDPFIDPEDIPAPNASLGKMKKVPVRY